MPYLCGSSR
ncbi:hypothetical protein D039_2809A, partial [Vibrio parahaemolyticus EKP-028]